MSVASSGGTPGDVAAALEALAGEGPPTTIQQLEQRVAAIAAALGVTNSRARILVSCVIVAQMLPPGSLVKGGIGVKFRLGELGTRATSDIDVVTRDHSTFLASITQGLAAGWGSLPPSRGAVKKNAAAPPRVPFTGTVRPVKQRKPPGVPPEYLMRPYKVTLQFLTTSWAAVPLEVAHDEIDGSEYAGAAPAVAEQIAAIGAALGFGTLAPVPLISLEQQIAQKIHAVTHPHSERAHDLVDLQLLWHAGTEQGQRLDLPLLAQLCQRTFDYRGTHPWPPDIALPELLEPAYQDAREEAADAGVEFSGTVDLASTMSEAMQWLTGRIAEIDDAVPRPR